MKQAEKWLQKAADAVAKGNAKLATQHVQKALRSGPDRPDTLFSAALLYYRMENLDYARDLVKRAINEGAKPDYWNLLGLIYKHRGDMASAAGCFEQAIRLNPRYASGLLNRAACFMSEKQYDLAAAPLLQAVRANPKDAVALYELSQAYQAMGNPEAAFNALNQARTVNPGDQRVGSQLLLTLNFLDSFSAQDIAIFHRKWGEFMEARTGVLPDRSGRDAPGRLRIGYLSTDFHRHSVAYFIEPVLRSHDRERFEVFCYHEVMGRDEVTERLRGYADGWRETSGIGDEALARQIRDDGIDILVDLAGHTRHSRVNVLAYRPAPIQVTYLGYPNTTGLSRVDYRLTDGWADPEGYEPYYSEELVRLPHGFLCYAPPETAPEVEAPPVQRNGYVTFGSFNHAAKATRETILTWSQVLKAVEDSTLLLKDDAFGTEAGRERFLKVFAEEGIGRERVSLIPRIEDPRGHLALYNEVDVALDTFPYNGTTTTFEALWMGVPVVTSIGDRHAARVGYSILSQAGLEDCVAATREGYVERAAGLAGDAQRLQELRMSMRERLSDSPLLQAGRFTQAVEAAYTEMWERYSQVLRRDAAGA